MGVDQNLERLVFGPKYLPHTLILYQLAMILHMHLDADGKPKVFLKLTGDVLDTLNPKVLQLL